MKATNPYVHVQVLFYYMELEGHDKQLSKLGPLHSKQLEWHNNIDILTPDIKIPSSSGAWFKFVLTFISKFGELWSKVKDKDKGAYTVSFKVAH